MLQIGFNGRHSTELIFSQRNDIELLSFDLGKDNAVQIGCDYISKNFPNTHSLIIGDICVTVPEYAKCNENIKFDLIFIDGGHTFEIASKDIENCKELAHADTIVIMDDVNKPKFQRFGEGSYKAWRLAKESNIVFEEGHDYHRSRYGFAWGKYIF